jgi:hypothetical protein
MCKVSWVENSEAKILKNNHDVAGNLRGFI